MNITQLESKRRAAERQLEQLTAPQRALTAAEQELTALDQQIEAARVQAEKAGTMARLVEHASAGAAALAAIEQAQKDFDAAIGPLLAAYGAACDRQASARQAFYVALGTLAPGAQRRDTDPEPALQLLDDLEATGADLAGVLVGLDGRGMPLDRPYQHTHAFPGALQQALRELFIHQGGHLPPVAGISPVVDSRTAAQLLAGTPIARGTL